jgi:hypothetical protein
MSSSDVIGGYFGLELPPVHVFPHQETMLLNSGRACFEYVLRVAKPAKVYLPKFTCDAMLEPLQRTDTSYEFYEITDQLEIREDITLTADEYLVYTNYFGIKDDYSRSVAKRYSSQLILDCAQAFYMEPPSESHTLYSPRKFFGLPDGGMLHSAFTLEESLPNDTSTARSIHLLKRLDVGAEGAYEDFKRDDASLSYQPMRTMSALTRRLMNSIDYDNAQAVRRQNYTFLHEQLGGQNRIIVPVEPAGPLCYPFRAMPILREKLIEHKIFVPLYWPNVKDWTSPDSIEYALQEEVIALPIDQRYGIDDMQRILEVIHE